MERVESNLPVFSFFKRPVYNSYPTATYSVLDAYNYIVGDQAKEATETLRTIDGEDEQREFKEQNFDYCTFSGTFPYRKKGNLEKHSGYLIIDLDHLDDIEKVRQQLLNDEYFDTQLLFVSPRGHGLKWLVEINLDIASHDEYFDAITNYLKQTYNLDVDQSGRDVCRPCFLPYDPTCFINPKYLANE